MVGWVSGNTSWPELLVLLLRDADVPQQPLGDAPSSSSSSRPRGRHLVQHQLLPGRQRLGRQHLEQADLALQTLGQVAADKVGGELCKRFGRVTSCT